MNGKNRKQFKGTSAVFGTIALLAAAVLGITPTLTTSAVAWENDGNEHQPATAAEAVEAANDALAQLEDRINLQEVENLQQHEEEYPKQEIQTESQETEVQETNVAESSQEEENNEGCSPYYWKNNPESWESTEYSSDQKLSEVTDIEIPSEQDYTLLEALDTQSGGYDALARQFAAALLNSDHPDVEYAFSTDKVISMYEDGADPQIIESSEYNDDNDTQEQKNSLADANDAGCSL